MNSKIILIIIFCVAVIGAAWLWYDYRQNTALSGLPPSISAVFSCPDGEQIDATFVNGNNPHVDLTFSDGTNISLPQAISADGARYANADESFVFWNVGDSAMVQQNGTTTLSDCMASSTTQ